MNQIRPEQLEVLLQKLTETGAVFTELQKGLESAGIVNPIKPDLAPKDMTVPELIGTVIECLSYLKDNIREVKHNEAKNGLDPATSPLLKVLVGFHVEMAKQTDKVGQIIADLSGL